MKRLLNLIAAFLGSWLLIGCVAQETLTPEQRAQQQQIDSIIADTLFDSGLNDKASYEVKHDGEVVILFTPDVPEKQYTEVVRELRSNPDIPSLRAEQDGKHVCPLRN